MKEIIITSSVLILCIMLIRIIFKGKISSRLQYALWLLVAIRLMIPASAQIYMTIGSVEGFRIMDLTRMLETKVGDVTERLEQPVTFVASMNGVAGELAAEYILENDGDPFTTADGPTSVFVAGKIGLTWVDVLRGIWIGGMIVVALWMIIVNIAFVRRLHKGRKEYVLECDDLPWSEKLQGRGADKKGGKLQSIKIYTIDKIASPCLYGMPFREAIYLTTDIAEDKDRLRHVLTHEMCHKKHGDSFWSIVRSILLIIYWMNPLVWAAAVLSKRDCELACDEEALLVLGEEERISYGETLLSIITSKGKLSDFVCTATTMTGSGKSVKERIKFIAREPHILGVTVAALLVLVMAISVLVFTKNPLFHGDIWEGDITLSAGGMQITLPESIAGISGYDTDGNDDIVIYQVTSGEEAGRFCEVSYGEAVLLVEQGREVIPIGDYGRNPFLKEYMRSLYPNESVSHNYTPNSSTDHNYDAPNDSIDHNYHAPDNDIYHHESESDWIEVPGTDSMQIPSPQDTDWEVIPLSPAELEEEIKFKEEEIKNIEEELVREAQQEAESEMQEQERMLQEVIKQREEEIAFLKQQLEAVQSWTGGVPIEEDVYISEGVGGSAVIDDDTTYVIDDDTGYVIDDDTTYIIDGDAPAVHPQEESIDYLPNEEITVTYFPATANTAKCYIYVKGDYSGVKAEYLQELNYIDSVLKTVTEQAVVTDSDAG